MMATEYSMAQAEGLVDSIFPRNTAFIDPLRPETSRVLQSILDEALSTDEMTRLLAIRRFKDIFQPFLRTASAESAVHASAFLLERGFMKAINQGLEESVAGHWLLVPNGREKLTATAEKHVPVLLKPIICVCAVECLAVDSRTVKYLLKMSPRLSVLLELLFSKELTLGKKKVSGCWPEPQIKQAIISTIPRLLHSMAFRKEIGQSTDFLAAVMRHTVADFENQTVVNSAVSIIHTLQGYCFTAASANSLVESFLHFAAKVFAISSNKMQILCTIETLSTFVANCVSTSAGARNPLPEISGLNSSVLALLLCDEESDNMSWCVTLAAFAGHLEHSAAKKTSSLSSGPCSIEEMKRNARGDQAAVQRAAQLRTILMSKSAGEGWAHIYPLRSADRDATEEEAVKRGLAVKDRRAARKCSGPGCEKFEDEPGEFRRCGACRLAVYCGPGEKIQIVLFVDRTVNVKSN